jgi:hypothetical protein
MHTVTKYNLRVHIVIRMPKPILLAWQFKERRYPC